MKQGCQRLLKTAFVFILLSALTACGGAGSDNAGASGPGPGQSSLDSVTDDPAITDSDTDIPVDNTGSDPQADPPSPAEAFIFDWSTFSDESVDSESLITPAPHAYYNDVDWRTVLQTQHLSAGPVALMLRNSTAPYGGERWYTLNDVLAYVNEASIPLDFVFSDFESETEVEDTLAMLRQLNENQALDHSRLYVGGYRYFPGEQDASATWGDYNRSEAHRFYMDSGLNVAMPNLYPYAAYINHHRRADLHSQRCVSDAHALFWAPLEKASVAKRALPDGHRLIPWLGGFVDSGPGYDAPHPSREDVRALVQHLRLRGVDGYYTWSHGGNRHYLIENDDNASRRAFRDEVAAAWSQLDSFFAGADNLSLLNLATDKTGGLEWSGMRSGHQIELILSNFNENAINVDLSVLTGIAGAPQVHLNPQSHRRISFSTE